MLLLSLQQQTTGSVFCAAADWASWWEPAFFGVFFF
jgi:hypothetical protein